MICNILSAFEQVEMMKKSLLSSIFVYFPLTCFDCHAPRLLIDKQSMIDFFYSYHGYVSYKKLKTFPVINNYYVSDQDNGAFNENEFSPCSDYSFTIENYLT